MKVKRKYPKTKQANVVEKKWYDLTISGNLFDLCSMLHKLENKNIDYNLSKYSHQSDYILEILCSCKEEFDYILYAELYN